MTTSTLKQRLCPVPGCKAEQKFKGFCEAHYRDKVCPGFENGHTPLPWSIWECQDGTKMAKCGRCKKGYILQEPPG